MRRSCGLNLDATFRSVTSKEDSLVSHEGGAGRSYFGIFTKEPGLISFVTLSLHIGGNNAVMHILELSSDSVFSSDWSSSITSIEELASGSIVLTCCVRHFILEELLLGKLEGRVIAYFLGHILERILCGTIGPAGLLKLAVLELFNLLIILTSVELGVGVHVLFLLVLGNVL